MKLIKLVVLTSSIAMSGAVFADNHIVNSGETFQAKQLIPSGVRAEVGSTGYGGALLWTANPYVGLALGYNGGDISWSDNLSVNGSKYDMDMNNKTAYLNAEIRPWGASNNALAKGFYVATGVAYIDNSYDLDRRVGADRTFSVNGKDFKAGTAGAHISGKMKYEDDIAPYVGLGIAPKFNKNWGVFGEVGAYYTGNPKVNLDLISGGANTVADSLLLGGSIQDEQDKIANKDKYEWMPVGKVGVSFHW